jgi:hypothetical protein
VKAKSTVKKKTKKRFSRKVVMAAGKPVCLHRRCTCEFSCGVPFERALLVEESLNEREKRG